MRRRPKPYFIFLLFFILVALVAGGRLLIQAIPDRPPAPSAEEPGSLRVLEGGADVLYRVRYKQCGHLEPLGGGKEPISFFNLSGLSQPELQALLPEGWGTVDFSPGKVVLENSATGLCSVCREKMYLGVRGDRIAIFRGVPPTGIPERITEYEVKDDVRDQLEKGIPFTGMDELMQLLESYTS